MDSQTFFDDKEFNGKFKGKSGIYIVEQPVFTKYIGYPVYKIGFGSNLYVRISNYRTMYGLVPFKIHCLYAIPQGIFGGGSRTNHANLMEKMIQRTATKYGEFTGVGEWYKNLTLLMSIVSTIREVHLLKFKDASKWEFYHQQHNVRSLKKIDLVLEKDIGGIFKDVIYGERTTRSGKYTDKLILEGLNVPTSYIDENGKEVKFKKAKRQI